MRMSQVFTEIKKICENKDINHSSFIVYDSFKKCIVNKNLRKFPQGNTLVIPVCIRQEYFSHMCVFIITTEKIIYYDPDRNRLPEGLYRIVRDVFPARVFLQDNININHETLHCTRACIDYINQLSIA